MFPGLERITSHRIWFVPDFVVWGLPNEGNLEFLAHERIGESAALFYGSEEIGDASQQVLFNTLTDHRGNLLPATIKSPRVIPRPHQSGLPFITGHESNNSFFIARDTGTAGPVMTDLLIIEMGQ